MSQEFRINYPRGDCVMGKVPQTILEVWNTLYPGNVAAGKHPHVAWCDNGGTFLTCFRAHVITMGAEIRNSIRNRPKSHGFGEKFNHVVETSVRTMMVESAVPLQMWSDGVRYFFVVYPREKDRRRDDLWPFERVKSSR